MTVEMRDALAAEAARQNIPKARIVRAALAAALGCGGAARSDRLALLWSLRDHLDGTERGDRAPTPADLPIDPQAAMFQD